MDDPVHPKLETGPDNPSPDPTNDKSTALQVTPCSGISLRKKRSLDDKICRICGDKALAHNFDVITCESCKAFFRRNALKREEVRKWDGVGWGGQGRGTDISDAASQHAWVLFHRRGSVVTHNATPRILSRVKLDIA